MNKFLAVFGQSVRAYRTAADLTQEQAAERADLHAGYFGTVERGEKNISLLNIVDVCKALDVPPSKLMAVLDGIYNRAASSAKTQQSPNKPKNKLNL